MMMKLLIALAAAGLIAATADATACHDAKGKFIKCPTAASAPAGITKDAKGRCHAAGGKFVACPK